MSHLTSFQFADLPLRAILIDKQPWFVAKDVCEVLQYANTPDALARHVDDDDRQPFNMGSIVKRDRTGGNQTRVSIINESGLYSLIMGSKQKQAKAFKKWVTSTVLPSLRQHGAYAVDVERLPPASQKALLTMFARIINESTRRHDRATQHDHFIRNGDKRRAHSLEQAERIGREMGISADVVFAAATYGSDEAFKCLTAKVPA